LQQSDSLVPAQYSVMRATEAPAVVSDAGWRSLAAAARKTAPAMIS
jgi:hypothetical protein